MSNLPNLLIVAGSGTKSGKTSMICRLIEQSRDLGVIAVKVSPHFHSVTPGLAIIAEGKGFAIYEETDPGTSKDTSRMLRSGAAQVFLVLVWDSELEEVFRMVVSRIPEDRPVVCESPALRRCYEPGLFIIMSSLTENRRPDLEYLCQFPHLSFRLEDIGVMKQIPVSFSEGTWRKD